MFRFWILVQVWVGEKHENGESQKQPGVERMYWAGFSCFLSPILHSLFSLVNFRAAPDVTEHLKQATEYTDRKVSLTAGFIDV